MNKLVYLTFYVEGEASGGDLNVGVGSYKTKVGEYFNKYAIFATLTFDKLDSINIEENLNVCTTETIRGKNKTFNAFLEPKSITINAKFDDHQSTNIELKGEYRGKYLRTTDVLKNEEVDIAINENYNEGIDTINRVIGKEKSKKLEELFNSLVEETKLIDVKMFYKTYENYVLTGFNLSYDNNSVITVELTLQEVLLRHLQEGRQEQESLYTMVNELSEYESKKYQYILDNLNGFKYYLPSEIEKAIGTAEYTYSQGGHYE